MATQPSPFTYEAVTIGGYQLRRVLVGERVIGLMQRVPGGWAAVEVSIAHGAPWVREKFTSQVEVGWYWLKRKGARG